MRGLGTAAAAQFRDAAPELVAMALEVVHHPEACLRRAALAHAVRDLIRSHGDAPLIEAFEAAPDVRITQLLGATAEAASETATSTDRGAPRETRLFTVAIVSRFPAPITAHEFEHLFGAADACAHCLVRLQGHCQPGTLTVVLPHTFVFEDIARLSYSSVHKLALLASSALPCVVAGALRSNATPVFPGAQRRSATFVRCLVGYHLHEDGASANASNDDADLRRRVRSEMRAKLPDARDVVVFYGGGFHRPLWHAARLYCSYRLSEVVIALARQSVPARRIRATVCVGSERTARRADIAFACERQSIQRGYTVPLRRYDDARPEAQRIAARLRTLGVETRVTASCNGTARGSSRHVLRLPL